MYRGDAEGSDMKIIAYILVLTLLSISVSAQSLEIPQVNVSFLNQDPDPVGPARSSPAGTGRS